MEVDSEQLGTVRDAARLLNLPYKSIYILCARGELPHYRVGNQIRFSNEQLRRYLASRERGGA